MKLITTILVVSALLLTACQQTSAPSGDLPTLASLDNQSQATPTAESLSEGAASSSASTVLGEPSAVGSFSAIVQNLPATVTISAGAEASVQIEADSSVLALIQSTISNDTLDLRLPAGTTLDNAAISVRVTVPTLRALTLNGSGVVNISSFVVDALQIDLSGSGDILLQPLTAQSVIVNIAGQGTVDFASLTSVALTANIAGSGTIDVLGNAETLTLTAPGSGEVRAADLLVRAATLDIGGSLNVQMNVTQQLDVTIGGSGTVTFSGTPQVNANVTGGGRVLDSAGNVVAGG